MSSKPSTPAREGSLEAPTRHPVAWKDPEFLNEESLFKELERVFDICHGCRRCFSLCNSFPTLFDAIDESSTGELDGVDRKVYWNVVDHCYLCDMCYMTKCPYVPPHPWNVDFPHLMLRAKTFKFKNQPVRTRDRILSATDRVGSIAGIPVIAEMVNAIAKTDAGRSLMDKALGVHRQAPIPEYHSRSYRKRHRDKAIEAQPAGETRGRVVLFTTCYGNRNEPDLNEDLTAIFEHNGIEVTILRQEKCCGMPKLELGDLESIERLKDANIPALAAKVDEGWDIVTPIPSCTLMFKQELPLLFPQENAVARVRDAMFDPFEYLWARYKAGLMKTDFPGRIGKVSYHVACHLRVQNLGLKTRDVLMLIPDTQVDAIERCSGHNGTYGVKHEYRDVSMKIGKPVIRRVNDATADHYSSDCPMAGHQIESGLESHKAPTHPLRLLRLAYGI
ncbi:MAG TPA: heterodisulfide reductase-related iron-sulfur binding cluster [Povalibacter sp.]|uniref:heterodisulfide reductase-related iron-sulfur binding cluster n=1 Tax=Povalibacter sp. TaxID=1962978 RepID=UPI002D0DA3E3|nr:heterodisulfide reductase-related iron-sulfur binding cluster [Povalibacter sp.]HMN46720.1 heterodisulfide reductase-related iron-sulfur binding cluster [Povalibacter sp.]